MSGKISGRWKMTAETIEFSSTHTLRSGQVRQVIVNASVKPEWDAERPGDPVYFTVELERVLLEVKSEVWEVWGGEEKQEGEGFRHIKWEPNPLVPRPLLSEPSQPPILRYGGRPYLNISDLRGFLGEESYRGLKEQAVWEWEERE